MSIFKPKKAFYSVHALRDGTIWFAVQTKKPRKTRDSTPEIDQDGIFRWFLNEDDPDHLPDWGKAMRYGAIANCLNLKRVVRQQVKPKLDELISKVSELQEQIARLESKIEHASD